MTARLLAAGKTLEVTGFNYGSPDILVPHPDPTFSYAFTEGAGELFTGGGGSTPPPSTLQIWPRSHA